MSCLSYVLQQKFKGQNSLNKIIEMDILVFECRRIKQELSKVFEMKSICISNNPWNALLNKHCRYIQTYHK